MLVIHRTKYSSDFLGGVACNEDNHNDDDDDDDDEDYWKLLAKAW